MLERYAVGADETASRVLDDEAVILDFGSGYYFGLNRTGTALWQLLQAAPRSAETLTRALATAHGVAADEVAPDVRLFLDRLVGDALASPTEADEPAAADLDPPVGNYVAPTVERYEKLDDLMLSGE